MQLISIVYIWISDIRFDYLDVAKHRIFSIWLRCRTKRFVWNKKFFQKTIRSDCLFAARVFFFISPLKFSTLDTVTVEYGKDRSVAEFKRSLNFLVEIIERALFRRELGRFSSVRKFPTRKHIFVQTLKELSQSHSSRLFGF